LGCESKKFLSKLFTSDSKYYYLVYLRLYDSIYMVKILILLFKKIYKYDFEMAS